MSTIEAKVIYSKSQLEDSINFIATHNKAFINEHNKIRLIISDLINDLVSNGLKSVSTIGVTITLDLLTIESMDYDENVFYISFTVDPSIGNNLRYSDADDSSLTITISSEVLKNYE